MKSADSSLDSILRSYPWFDHPEGMKFAEAFRDAHRSVGHWLFLPGQISAFHRVMNCDEVWAIILGRVHLHVIDTAGVHQVLRLGVDFAAGEIPTAMVPRGAWQAAEIPEGVPFAFGLNVCAPAFDYAELQIGRRDELTAEMPQYAAVIQRLSR